MKKRASISAAACGLLFLGAATWPQDPTAGEPVARQAAPPRFRDVLRGKVGQECRVGALYGIWTLQFSAAGQGKAEEKEDPVKAGAQVPSYQAVEQALQAHGVDPESFDSWGSYKVTVEQFIKDLTRQGIDGNLALVNPSDLLTVVAVGQDFVQLREADGTERYVPLSRVDVVVMPAGK